MLRNLLTTIRRFTLSTTLNVVGLSIAFAAFIVIMMQVQFERGYGKNDPNHAEIFRLEWKSAFSQGKWIGQIPGAWIVQLELNEPKIKSITYYDDSEGLEVASSDTATVWSPTIVYWNYTDLTKTFQFDMVHGNTLNLLAGDNVIIPQSLAATLYPRGDAVGQTINLRGKWFHENPKQTIVGVYRDFPVNATLGNGIYGGKPSRRQDPKTGVLFDAGRVYIRCAVEDTAQVMNNLRKTQERFDIISMKSGSLRLTPIGDIYYADDFMTFDDTQPGNRATTDMLLWISILIILIASINFINFATALAPMRIKGLNTRLVFGKSRAGLRRMLIFEAVGISVIGYCVAIMLVEGFNSTSVAALIRTSSTALADNLPIVFEVGALAVAVGFLAGIYPAFYCTRFTPALVLKGFGMGSASGKWIRIVLIGFQYVISTGLIIGSLFIAKQNHYLSTFPVGFDKQNVLITGVQSASQNERERLRTKLLENPDVTDCTLAWGTLGRGYGGGGGFIVDGDTLILSGLPVFHNFMRFFDIPIVEGRDFVQEDYKFLSPDQRGFVYNPKPGYIKTIFNRKAQQMFDLKVDSIYNGRLCVGICENINATALYNDYEPMYFELNDFLGHIYIKFRGENTEQIYDFVEKTYKELEMPDEFYADLLENTLQEAYIKEKNLATMINIFSTIAIIISLIGVFGLVVFETQYRRKEIGIRKVFGSRTNQILMMFNLKFIYIVLVCFVIAVPPTYYLVSEWLSGFAFRTPMPWWVFAAALAIVGAITIATVTIQSFRAANENPVKSLKSE